MGQLSEFKSVEKPVTEWLSKMGWDYKIPDELKEYQRPLSNPIIEPILLQKIEEINNIPQSFAKEVYNQLIHNLNNPNPILGNEAFLQRLEKGITINIDGKGKDCQLIDFEEINNNSFIVTNQYFVQGFKLIKTDIVLLINGIPLIPIEAKQRARKGTNWLEGVKQFSTYKIRAEKLFMCHLFGVACNGRITKYGIPGASSSYFNEWKETFLDTDFENPILDPANDLCSTYFNEDSGYHHFDVERLPNGEVLERMKLGIIGLLQPARVLDILKNFIVFERTEGKILKKVARYQQLRASNKIVDRVVKSDEKQGVIWHTQGSGKSLTMLFTAYKLRKAAELKDPTVYIVVDRKNLREQIGGTFDDCEFPNSRPILNIADLKYVIDNAPAGVFITTVQKFRELGNRKDDRDNVIILIDEAHRTEYGIHQIELQSVLPNARRFAFTGTPIDKTIKEFGIREGRNIKEYYLDKYGIKQAIKDGATKPVRYTFGPQKWHLDKEKLKEGFDEITADLTEEQTRRVERRVQPWKVFLKHPERISILAKDIVTDFREVLEPQGYKAQIVACDKEACVLYYNELVNKDYFDSSEIAIIFSTGNYDDEERYNLYKDHYISDVERKKLIEKFKRRITEKEQNSGNNLKIFIVCNMLLTGFDAPIEQTMYLDSPIKDHNLLQAIARTNRPYDDPETKMSKQFGRVVDYIGIFKNYNEALNYDHEDIGEVEDVDSLVLEFPKFLDNAMQPFDDIELKDSYECSMKILRILSTLDQGSFENDYKEVIQLFEAVSPHPKLRDHIGKYLWLNEIYEIYLEEFKRVDFDAEIFASKTRKLIEENSSLIGFKGHLPEIIIDDKYIDNLNLTDLNPSDKAEKIIRDIETIIRLNESENPIYVEFQERLDELIKQKEEASKEIEEILNDLEGMYSDMDDIASLPHRMGFDDRGSFDVFTEIKISDVVNFEEEIAKSFSKTLINDVIKKRIYAGWQDNDMEIKRIRNAINIHSATDEYLSLKIYKNDELLDQVLNRIIQHYCLD